MLLRGQGSMVLERIQGAFIDDNELAEIISAAKAQRAPEYIDEYVKIGIWYGFF